MNSEQLRLAADIIEEYERGESPAWEAYTEHGWGQFTTRDSVRLAMCNNYPIRRGDPYQKFKDALAAGKRVRCGNGRWRDHPDHFAWGGNPADYEIEPDWQLPPPPPGREWQHAAKWTKDMLPEGYRPMLIGEMGSYEFNVMDQWEVGECVTVRTNNQGSLERTNRPLPGIPLTAADVPFGARFRFVGNPVGSMAATITADHIVLLGYAGHTYAEAAKHLEMSTDGVTWKPCTK